MWWFKFDHFIKELVQDLFRVRNGLVRVVKESENVEPGNVDAFVKCELVKCIQFHQLASI